MRKLFSFAAIFAAAVMAIASCQKPDMEPSENLSDGVVVSGLTFSSEKPAFDDETKTEWNEDVKNVYWSEGDKIRVGYTCDGIWQNAAGTSTSEETEGSKTAKLYVSDDLKAMAQTALFTIPDNFKTIPSGEYVFYGIYPSSVNTSTDFKSAPSYSVTIPATQTPLSNSFDSAADLMIGQSEGITNLPENKEISLNWTRLVALGHITLADLKDFAAEEKINEIVLVTKEGVNIAGKHTLDLTTGAISGTSGDNELIIKANNLEVKDGSVTFWACLLPKVITELKVVVKTNLATYTRDITGISLDFKRNMRNILTVKMDEANRAVPTESTVANVLKAEVDANVWYKVKGTVSNITNTTYGNFTLTDGENSIVVYGLTQTAVYANDKSFSSIGLKEGDIVTLVGTRAEYNSTAQIGGPAYYVTHEVGTPAAPAEGISCTMIDKVADLSAGTYYMAGYMESYTYNGTTTNWANNPYHVCIGMDGNDIGTREHSYSEGLLVNCSGKSESVVTVTLEAVNGKSDTYYIKLSDKYLYSTACATRKLALDATKVEWVASNHLNGIILTTTMTEGTVSLGTASASSNLIRSYKCQSSGAVSGSIKDGLVFFKKNSEK